MDRASGVARRPDGTAAGSHTSPKAAHYQLVIAGTDARVSKPRSPRGCRCRRRSWCPSRPRTQRNDAVRPGMTALAGVIVRVGYGEADGVAAGLAASADVDKLVDKPQAKGRTRKRIVG